MSRRWGMCIPFSSFAKDICLASSGIVHQPAIGEKHRSPVSLRDFRGDGESAFSLIFVVLVSEVLDHLRVVRGSRKPSNPERQRAAPGMEGYLTSTVAPCSS